MVVESAEVVTPVFGYLLSDVRVYFVVECGEVGDVLWGRVRFAFYGVPFFNVLIG